MTWETVYRADDPAEKWRPARDIGIVTERWVDSDPTRQNKGGGRRGKKIVNQKWKETQLGDWLSEGRGRDELEVRKVLERQRRLKAAINK